MSSRIDATLPRRLIDRLWPQAEAMAALFPSLRVSDDAPGAEVLGRLGSLEVRLSRGNEEIRQAQKLRYRVFYKEGSAIAGAAAKLARRDIDAFDAVCDHLLVIDHAMAKAGRRPTVVGTYRLLQQGVAEQHGGFYTESEFDIGQLVSQHHGLRFLELGRSCVLTPYRNKRTVELLWHGIGAYLAKHPSDVLFGCASIDGTDPDVLSLPLSFLHHHARAPEAWRAWPVRERHVEMNRMPKEAIDTRAALRALPPLIKAYLRLGASIGEGAVIDRQFGTTDVLIVLPVSAIKSRYLQHFSGGTALRGP